MRHALTALAGAGASVMIAAAQAAFPSFEPASPDLMVTGALTHAWADVDGDDDLDLFVGFGGAANRLYRNDAGRLTDVAAAAGVADARATRAAAWGDADADGDPDLMLGFAPGDPGVLRLYENDGGRFRDRTRDAGLWVETGAVRQLAWVDVDGDGDLDLFVAFRDRANALYRNDGARFTDIAAAVGLADARRSVGAVWFDADEDGDLDLYVANQDGDANGFFRHDAGRFTDVAADAGLAWGGREPAAATNGTVRPCAADIDGDGRLDLFTANYGPNGLFLNRGGGRFEDVSASWNVAIDARYDTCAFADVDHDGDLDLFVNGTVTGGVSYRDYLFRNTGARFEDVTPAGFEAIEASHGASWVDFDRDGDVDLTLAGTRPAPLPLVLRNLLPAADARRSLAIRVVDARGRAVAAGAEVRVRAAAGGRLLATRLVDSGSGYNAQHDGPVHVGLPTLERVDVEVIRPRGGSRRATVVPGVDPAAYHGRALVVALDAPAQAPAAPPADCRAR